jgi:hypothetical protein
LNWEIRRVETVSRGVIKFILHNFPMRLKLQLRAWSFLRTEYIFTASRLFRVFYYYHYPRGVLAESEKTFTSLPHLPPIYTMREKHSTELSPADVAYFGDRLITHAIKLHSLHFGARIMPVVYLIVWFRAALGARTWKDTRVCDLPRSVPRENHCHRANLSHFIPF